MQIIPKTGGLADAPTAMLCLSPKVEVLSEVADFALRASLNPRN
jgi:hypothetical protein